MKKSLLGIDIGTSNIKVILFDVYGNIINKQKSKTPLIDLNNNNRSEFNGETIWNSTISLLKKTITKTKKSHQILSITCASFAESGIPINNKGEVIGNSLIWYDDRTKNQELYLRNNLKNYKFFEISGMRFDYVAGLCKILWFKDNYPKKFQRIYKWLNMADYINYKLCGIAATDLSLAGRTLLLDIKKRNWNFHLLNKLKINSKILPLIINNGKILGYLKDDIKKKINLINKCPIIIGGHDHVMAAISSGIFTDNYIQDSIGTSESIIINTPRLIKNKKFIDFYYEQGLIKINKSLFYLQCGLNSSTKTIELFLKKNNLKLNNKTKEELIKKYKLKNNKIIFKPLFNYKTTSKLKNNANGFCNANKNSDKITLLLSILEGICFETNKMINNLLLIAPLKKRKILCTGGGTKNSLYIKIKSNVYGKKIYISENYESVSQGAAILGGIAVGEYKNLQHALKKIKSKRKIIHPEKDIITYYKNKYLKYIEFIKFD